MKTDIKNDDNFLELIPVKNIEWAQDDNGKVYLIKEKTKSKIIKKIIDFLNKQQFFNIHLDDHGTAAWLSIDGEKTVHDISQILKEKFGDDFTQAEERVSFFVGNMSKHGFVQLKQSV